jgi:hypothetical protein
MKEKENERLRAQVEHEQKQVTDCEVMLAVYREVNERLRAAIGDAPHDSYCSSVGHGPASETNPCDCWKRKALEE